MIANKNNEPTLQVYKVLIIDDYDADFEIYQRYLSKDEVYTYSITRVETANEGLAIFLTEDFDIILLDFSLPDMNGLELLEKMQKAKKLAQLPVILMTGQGSEAIALQAMKNNIQDYFIKGELDFSRFTSGIHRLIEGLDTQQNNIIHRVIDILIVGDNQAELDTYKSFLTNNENTHFNIYVASTISEVLKFLQNKKVDVILTDYQLSDGNGLDLATSFKSLRHSYDTCIIMMTANGNEQLVAQAIKAGISDYLIKQFITADTLRQSIKDTFLKYQLLSQMNKAQFQRELLSRISLKIRKTIDLNEIMQASVIEVKNYLQCDRVILYRLDQHGNGKIVSEAVATEYPSVLGLNISDTFFENENNRNAYLKHGRKQVINNILEFDLSPCHRNLLEQFQVKSSIVLPVIIDDSTNPLWGLLVAHFCKDIHFWESDEIDFLTEITYQISIGIQQGVLVEALKMERDRANAATRAKSAFLANMSHEIRTPMNGILGMAEVLSMSDLGDEEQEFVSIIQSSGQSLLTLINDILDLSKLESGKIRFDVVSFSLRNLIKEVVNIFRVTAQSRNIAIEFDIADDLPDRYLGDTHRLKQILNNLVGNAIKFTHEGMVKLLVRRSVNQTDGGNEPLGNRLEVYFAIQDTGIGIPEDSLHLLFQPFSQVDSSTTRKFGGTGLGLTICKQLVELMGGKIGVESKPNEGTVFWFTTNLLVEEVVINSNSINGLHGLHGAMGNPIFTNEVQTAQILVVEDNETNQRVISSQLKLIGYICDTVANGSQVLEIDSLSKYKILLMDCQMPILDGYDTTRIIREERQIKDLIIIGTTAFAMAEDREKCLQAGMNDYLKKPFTIAELQQMLHKWL
ncbi:MAG: response regulator [Pseudanabaenaceae cyanobacterium bins.39]|nr:response regulator [Pseudanabaenaceae cyanobacterium bins.39]